MKTKCIISSPLARYLLRQGHRIVDIKPVKEDPKRTNFIFEDDGTLGKSLDNFRK